jgi:hypothetical protein
MYFNDSFTPNQILIRLLECIVPTFPMLWVSDNLGTSINSS